MKFLLNNDEIEVFKKEHFQVKPFVFNKVNTEALVTWAELNRLLEKDILHYPRVRLANDRIPEIRGYGGFVRYTNSQSGDRTPHINRFQLYKCLKDGATLVLDRCQSYLDAVDNTRKWLSEQLECTSSANLYAAFTSTPSFGLHFDNHDVLAVQIEGIKRWKIYNPTYPYPLEDERSFDFIPPNEAPDFELDVGPGEAIYLPAGYWHNVSTQTSKSLHITFTIIRPRRINIFNAIFDALKKNSYLRAPVAFGEALSDEKLMYDIFMEAVSELEIQVNETILKIQSRTPDYKSINLDNL